MFSVDMLSKKAFLSELNIDSSHGNNLVFFNLVKNTKLPESLFIEGINFLILDPPFPP